jgi:hypothetical protein
MVSYTPLPPLPVMPDTPYHYLDQRINVMLTQMEELMTHFRAMAGTPAPTPSPGTYVSAANGSATPGVSPTTPASRLEPTPDGQGPPPAVATSNAELIGDNHPAIRLLYTPRSTASNRRDLPIWPLPPSDFHDIDETRHLPTSLCRNKLFVSGYYWTPNTPVLDDHCVPWLEASLDGPYAGKPDPYPS